MLQLQSPLKSVKNSEYLYFYNKADELETEAIAAQQAGNKAGN